LQFFFRSEPLLIGEANAKGKKAANLREPVLRHMFVHLPLKLFSDF
jgi:hypothetical protein